MGPDGRRSLATVLVVLASVLLVGATVTGYARRAFFDSGQFADRATAALRTRASATLVGERVTDEIVLRHQADLLAARPMIESAVSERRGRPRVPQPLPRAPCATCTARCSPRPGHGDADAGRRRDGRGGGAPEAAARARGEVDASGRVELSSATSGASPATSRAWPTTSASLAYVLAALTLLAGGARARRLAATAAARSSRLGHRRGVGRRRSSSSPRRSPARRARRFNGPDERAAAGAVWDAYLGDLRTSAGSSRARAR